MSHAAHFARVAAADMRRLTALIEQAATVLDQRGTLRLRTAILKELNGALGAVEAIHTSETWDGHSPHGLLLGAESNRVRGLLSGDKPRPALAIYRDDLRKLRAPPQTELNPAALADFERPLVLQSDVAGSSTAEVPTPPLPIEGASTAIDAVAVNTVERLKLPKKQGAFLKWLDAGEGRDTPTARKELARRFTHDTRVSIVVKTIDRVFATIRKRG